ncbi:MULTISPECIES: PLP-dependent aminotransferase family protein [unclassified Streptomyces]|uniref:aminotransferase-like domain-containing protein n=1 Tax=unclassified Streptomyces TaxID=2593676 RepID=UPI0008920632|nr:MULTISPECIES: PLP-dependent aminotransferase family protein [unclassified Streptomyces]PBC83031.1 2-aminoadipate transaminase [Streptomyces sp. 2321.6]SDR45508.1 2-aminoadipate transaminase [Streptomyces sp. KS_16]SEC81369.1 2-aminoadipate transaminase [Streptomyces sp. 2133.1]SEE87504.1 2-aminoadipate transaminase [Streptomyces sp. 2112.3]SNC69109.1 2-aminoadipate transaminase [Streptomyces sp. 2114.4]
MPDSIPASAATAVPGLAARAARTGSSPVREILALTARPEVISFAGGLPAPELFDAAGIAAAFRHVLAEEPMRALQYSTSEGDPELRAAVAARTTARGLPTDADDLLVTTGSQQGLTLLATTLLEPGDVVLVEDPCYLAALQTFSFAGARVVPVPADDEGIDPAALDEITARERPRLLYLVPTFQNPTGRTLSAERRAAVAEVAARRGLWIAEDDPYGELRFEGEPVPWVASFPGAEDRTALLGSFSKVMAPGLRLGTVRAPAALRRACVIAKQAADLHTSTVDQAAAARYLAVADLDAHLRRVRDAYRARRDALVDGLSTALPGGSRWNRPAGGMFVWATLPEGYDATALLPGVVRHDVAYVPGAPFFAGPPDATAVRLSFVTHSPEEIREGLGRLQKALEGAGRDGRP